MARELTFRIGRKTFRAAPVKIDRRKLYGRAQPGPAAEGRKRRAGAMALYARTNMLSKY